MKTNSRKPKAELPHPWPDAPEAAPRPSGVEAALIEHFHSLYYASYRRGQTWADTFWLGHRALKCPLDMWLYQEIVFQSRPDLIIETGTAFGGSALFLATVCETLGRGRVLTIDVAPERGLPVHPRIDYLAGSSTSTAVLRRVEDLVRESAKVMVILDSDHHKEHVLRELELYSRFVSDGAYLIVEDTNLNGHPVQPGHGPGPAEAVKDFLARHPEFAPDRSKEKFLLSFNPGGYLKRAG